MHLHFGGRYDCRTGAVQQDRQGADLLDDLIDEAAQENKYGSTAED